MKNQIFTAVGMMVLGLVSGSASAAPGDKNTNQPASGPAVSKKCDSIKGTTYMYETTIKDGKFHSTYIFCKGQRDSDFGPRDLYILEIDNTSIDESESDHANGPETKEEDVAATYKVIHTEQTPTGDGTRIVALEQKQGACKNMLLRIADLLVVTMNQSTMTANVENWQYTGSGTIVHTP